MKWKIAALVLGAVVVYDEIHLVRANRTIRSQDVKMRLMADILDENNIKMTEFDEIVMRGY